MTNDTIAAISTPPGSGGIGVIRISGRASLEVLSGVFGRTREGVEDCTGFRSHTVYHGYVFEADGAEVIDEVLVIPMLAPKSYTSEDVVEIQAHSGNVVMNTLLERVLANGARLSDPGEFTRRAFLNGRIDLTQAEAVADIINARSVKSLKVAASQNTGVLKEGISQMRSRLMEVYTLFEASIDFPDEAGETIETEKALSVVKDVAEDCSKFIQRYNDACFIREGINVVICGAPNVGKSSLMNRLIENDRSIVTSVPGTTRDPVRESFNLNGIPMVVADTAGIHPTNDLVEIIGIEKAKEHITAADIILFMQEPGGCVPEKELDKVVPDGVKTVFVFNKTDLAVDDKLPEMPEKYMNCPKIGISALNNEGIDELREMIVDLAMRDLDIDSGTVVPNLRHKLALQEAAASLEAVENGLRNHLEEETLALDIKESIEALGRITGETAGIEVLDHIFSNFCIGK
ncbi:MAG: tRNA uridine-5-carboxymethylaminomethyl(34) synthesis GTPase MnmE [Desulfobacteraceae bacterium]